MQQSKLILMSCSTYHVVLNRSMVSLNCVIFVRSTHDGRRKERVRNMLKNPLLAVLVEVNKEQSLAISVEWL